jgi:hypothetical protein
MENNYYKESPFKTLISFHKVIETLEEIALSPIDYRSNYAKAILNEIASKPELREGIEDYNFIVQNEEVISHLLADLFPIALTNNEIKAVSLPFQNITFNYTARFKKILNDAGRTFDMNIRDFDDHQFYIMNCSLILNAHYQQKIDFSKPLFCDIPDEHGIMRHYRILYNADFIEIFPTENMKTLSDEDINLLIDQYDNLALWKEMFPPNSWILKGFVIVSLVDVTVENAVSNLKTYLLKPEIKEKNPTVDAISIFQSVFKIPDLKIGFTIYNEEEDLFERPGFREGNMSSFILLDQNEADCKNALCGCSYEYLIENKKPFVIPDVQEFANLPQNQNFGTRLINQNIQSCLLAPIMNNGKLLGIIELASSKVRAINSVNANKLEMIMPFLVDTVVRSFMDMQNQLEAIIQKEYTTIHPSVYWKFKNEARNYFQKFSLSQDYILKEIVFKNVFPLYGQIDIKGSSEHRNETVRTDLRNQLNAILAIFDDLNTNANLIIIEQKQFELNELLLEVDLPLKADTEQQIQHYIGQEIHPILHSLEDEKQFKNKIKSYFESLDSKIGMFYKARKDFDHTLSVINKKMASVLDAKQWEAQQIYPHYYERFKTDGVEHNLYIGESISPNIPYDKMYLSNLRLWQLQTLCEMELEHHRIKNTLPYELDVTSLILVFSAPISIRFRMDEKRFDVDGSYNARYEVVKKRIDKAKIKGTDKRITEKEKITIVYAQSQEEIEYRKYIKFLQHKNILEPNIEHFEIEDLQGVSGLKAFRVKVIHNEYSEKKYSYQDLLNELN